MTKKIPELLEYFIYDILCDDRISHKRVLSWHSIYFEWKIFAIFVFWEIYFRQNEKNKENFDKFNCSYFEYSRKNWKIVTMQYRILPEEIMEDKERLWEWIFDSIKQ